MMPGQVPVMMFHICMPFVLAGVVVVAVILIAPLLHGKSPSVPLKLLARLLVLLIPAAMVFALFKFDSMFFHPSSDGLDWRLLLPHSTWLFLVAWLTVVTIRSRAKQRATVWNERASLTRHKTVDITADGIGIRDAVTQGQYRWEAFVDFEETKKLFLVYESPKSAHFFPKRAFKGEEELSAMRALAELIPRVSNAAFPMQPADPPGAAQPVSDAVN
jgi:hypothetical protein